MDGMVDFVGSSIIAVTAYSLGESEVGLEGGAIGGADGGVANAQAGGLSGQI
jgi:hypothetical protein